MRRLGKNWKRLHRLVYPAAVLAVIHYSWLVKSDTRDPYLYGAILAVLLIVRTQPAKRGIAGLRRRLRWLSESPVPKVDPHTRQRTAPDDFRGP